MLVTLKQVIQGVRNYAVPAFNTWSFEDARAIIKGAEEMNSPVVLMTSGSAIKNWGIDMAAAIITQLAHESSVPVVLHLDHASDMQNIYKAMRAGYTSIMYDGSHLPLDENIANTATILVATRALGISLEAEIGQIGRGEEGEVQEEVLTSPEVAAEFVSRAPVDALAVAIGTCHGMQKQEAAPRLDLAHGISQAVSTPLVLHGSSGVTNGDLQRLSRLGFGKINFGTRLKHAYIDQVRNLLSTNASIRDHGSLFPKAADAVRDIVKEKISLIGSGGKAAECDC